MVDLVAKFQAIYGRLPTEVDPDYLEMLNMGRYRIIDMPDTPPGKCSNCGASKNDGRRYVDFGLQVDWYGTVHLCLLCLKEISTEAGLFKEIEGKIVDLVVENERLTELKEQGQRLYDTVMNTNKEFIGYYAHLHSLGLVGNSDDIVNMESDPPADEPDVNGPESRTTESSNVPRRKNVSKLTELLNSTD